MWRVASVLAASSQLVRGHTRKLELRRIREGERIFEGSPALATVTRVIAPDVVAVGGILAEAGYTVLDGVRSSAEILNLRAIGCSPEF